MPRHAARPHPARRVPALFVVVALAVLPFAPAASATARPPAVVADPPEITEAELAPLMDEGDGPVVLVIDDGELLKDVEAKDYLRALQRTAVDRGRAIVLGGDVNEVAGGFSGWQVDMKGRQGLLINPQSITDGELLGVRVPRSSLGNNPTTGRAFLNDGSGELELVQVPAE